MEKNLPQQPINNLVRFAFVAVLLASTAISFAQDPPPSRTSFVGERVTNPAIDPATGSNLTIVNGLETWETVPGDITTRYTQFVFTEDNWAFLVQGVGATIYQSAVHYFDIKTISPIHPSNPYISPIAEIRDQDGQISLLSLWLTKQEFLRAWDGGQSDPGHPELPINIQTITGVEKVTRGLPGEGGGWGTLFIPAGDGHQGGAAPGVTFEGTDLQNISTTNQIGLQIGTTGGNGGNGGDAYLSLSAPGDGGNGGRGGAVFVTNNAQVTTQSATIEKLHGIFAFSQSGTGGVAGTGVLSPSGGTGGDSPDGGNVTVTNNGLISTESRGGNGIYALSVSGNGGGGGSSWGLAGYAGSGGLTGNGGIVNVSNTSAGIVRTGGDFSGGILAQSIGGTGGSAGDSSNLLLNLPSQGQAGGDAGSVTVRNDGYILTEGNYSRGIQATSNGGGGGDQGETFGLISLGGQSGSGGNGGTVAVINSSTGTIETQGKGSTALYAQSVGGSGGSASDAHGVVSLGGSGAGGGNGGAVTVENYGTISTYHLPQSTGSKGIFAQSVGGGGGDGGSSGGMVSVGGRGGRGGFGSHVEVINGGSITTIGDNSGGIFAQSVGGGGGDGNSSNSVSIFAGYSMGGNGGDGGVGGNVDLVLQGGNISTNGIRSKGIMAQSVGGGGGTGGGSVQEIFGAFGAASVNIGGKAGTAGAGGEVSLKAGTGLNTIQTQGMFSQGVFLQSVGGSGGDGGLSVAVAIAAGPAAGSITVSQGGLGGAGGSAGIVRSGEFDAFGNLLSTGFYGNIQTDGEFSTGFFAQSVGGGGGNGGLSISRAAAAGGVFAGAVAIGLGGEGGGAGDGGVVQIGIQGNITTLQDKSIGLLAQSVGGGGGNGGASIAATAAASGGVAAGVQVSIGGSGGDGGHGGRVTLATQSSRIVTTGSNSEGIIAQSVGGGGGTGGYTISEGAAIGVGVAGTVSVGLGGSGGLGGEGGQVRLTVDTDVVTSGVYSHGVVAQSVGGGGGVGGYNISRAGSLGGAGAAVSIGLGGSGGSGGNGGLVFATSNGRIHTVGDKSNAFTAQSIGGGGGIGGYNVAAAVGVGMVGGAVSVGLGGSGAGAGHGGAVEANVYGDIWTEGQNSIGILAQSVGGGGGDGGYNISAAGGIGSTAGGGVSVGLGGSAGAGGNGGSVTLVVGTETLANTISIGELGGSTGIVAQSIGGGGGNGGFNVSATLAGAGTGAAAVGIGLGGSGGAGGNGGEVNSTVFANIYNSLDNGGFLSSASASDPDPPIDYVQIDAGGLLVQSVGGGGGNGGFNVTGAVSLAASGAGAIAVGIGGIGGDGGFASKVTSNFTGTVQTFYDRGFGIAAQSVGGSGGIGGMNVTGAISAASSGSGAVAIGLGGFGGGGGDAGEVDNTVNTKSGFVRTAGNNAIGILAQSVGGGGGVGGLNVTGAVSLSGGTSAAIGAGLGGFGGDAGNGSSAHLGVTGNVFTRGNDSHGLMAQSVGGSGGAGGVNITGSLAGTTSGSAGAISIGVGGFGGDGGNAGAVTLDYAGTIIAAENLELLGAIGAGSHGIVGQSLGGGGGIGGINVSAGIALSATSGSGAVFGVGGFGGAGGNADTVDVTVTGGESITTYGQGKSAIFAQSLGGGGGDGGINVSGGITAGNSLFFGVGGFAGDAGTAKKVTVNAITDVTVYQRQGVINPDDPEQTPEQIFTAAGVQAQSIGGGGGNGGMNVTGGIAFSTSSANTLTFGMGGFGGAGAAAGDVDVTLVGNANTIGTVVHGILAQSIGGGGGNGGLNVSGQISAGSGTDIAIVAGVGGNGGTGADAGRVDVNHTGSVTTMGDQARAVFAQSIGGGGGVGGMNVTGLLSYGASPITIGVGGSGGDAGGTSGAVTVTRGSAELSTGKLTTTGIGAHGIEAQSVGGGGGDAGMNFVGAGALGVRDTAYVVQFAVGGSGGVSGVASTATVDNFSDIQTNKDKSHGILAQSIGAGGGNGNYNIGVTGSKAPAAENGFTGAVTIGGQPGSGGEASSVIVTQVGNVETFGADSFGIVAQSIGGGGGNVGYDMGITLALGVTKNTISGSVQLGKIGGTGGAAGSVELNSIGSVHTHERGSYGLLAQSIGAGGGTSSTTTVSASSSEIQDGKTTTTNASVSIGRIGGAGGGSSDVTVNAAGGVTTEGESAHAIFAQSVGGGGGIAGSASTFAYNSNAPTIGIAFGGDGGEGGTSGKVLVTSAANLVTGGKKAIGILAQSVGGGGGVGGSSMTGGMGYGKKTVSLAVGGNGGAGNTSETVDVTSSGDISTDGGFSYGILAQSIGGGGGNSGSVINAVFHIPGDYVGTAADGASIISVQIGGDGGTGALSKEVTVTNTGTIVTNNLNSIGILAQSIGGGGGNAESVWSGNYIRTTDTSVLSFAIGGNGGVGGTGADVTVNNSGSESKISTVDDGSHGIFAMSLGGGGGIGSQVISADVTTVFSNDSADNMGITFGLGGSGAEGGTSGIVNVLNEGTIETHGAKAHGIIAQSIGGGGGQGGASIVGNVQYGGGKFGNGLTGRISIGGSGGSGNTASLVTVQNSGRIEVYGNDSYGVYAQSIGGGGGDGGFAIVASPNALSLDPFIALTEMAIGGTGGSGANGGDVVVTNTGSIISHGDNAFGIYAQSVGGGGGNAGWSFSSPAWTVANNSVSTLLGGGSSGTAGAVTVNNDGGDITMNGKNTNAKFTQSVNGGGGTVNRFTDVSEQAVRIGEDGIIIPTNPVIASTTLLTELGMNLLNHIDWTGTDAGAVTDSFDGGVTTEGSWSTASETQSIAGGGGKVSDEIVVDTLGEIDYTIELGGLNVENGDGGEINSVRHGEVTTLGDDSIGSEIQSIGGGGGSAIIGVKTILLPGHTSGFAIANAMLGGDATIGSDGGKIDSIYTGDLLTLGDRSAGLLLQSIGAGGGKATMLGFDSIDVGIGGQNAASGNGDNINVSNVGSIETDGALSHGVILQSIGGGGGAFLSDSSDIAVAANADNNGNGGDIDFAQTGDVIALGEGSIGILAQSLGGGGGFINRLFMDTAGGAGTSGAINLNVNGDVAATGENGVGIFAQSRGATSQGNIDIQFAADKRIIVGDSGVGVEISGGKENTFVNNGIVYAATTIGSPDGIAVRGSEGNDSITNNKILYGSVNLGSGVNALNNSAGAATYAGAELFIGDTAGDVFTNHGLLAPGDTSVYTTDLKGSYVQSITGEMNITLDCNTSEIDLLRISRTASLEGKINLILSNTGYLMAGEQTLNFLIAEEGIDLQDLELLAPVSACTQFSIVATPAPVDGIEGARFADAPLSSVSINFDVGYARRDGFNENQNEIGSYVGRVQFAGGSPELAPMVAGIFALPTSTELAAAYDSMSPEVYTSSQRNLELSSSRFLETMFGCNQLESSYKFNADGEEIATNRTAYQTMEDEASKGAGEGQDAAKKESHLFWVNTTAGFYTSSQTSQYMGFTADTIDFSAGVQWALTDEWYVGAALGHTTYTTNFSDGISATSEGTSSQIGAYVAKLFGPTKVSLGIAGGVSEIDVDRSNIFSATGPASGELDSAFFATRFRVSHNFDLSDWYIRPFLDLGFSSIHNNSLTETGAGAMNLVIDAGTYNVFTVSPTLQVGWEIKSGSLSIRPNASIGYTRYSNSAPSFSATLQGGPGGVSSFDVSGLNDLDYLNTSGGIDLAFSNSVVFQFVYSGQFSQNTSADNYQLKIVFPF